MGLVLAFVLKTADFWQLILAIQSQSSSSSDEELSCILFCFDINLNIQIITIPHLQQIMNEYNIYSTKNIEQIQKKRDFVEKRRKYEKSVEIDQTRNNRSTLYQCNSSRKTERNKISLKKRNTVKHQQTKQPFIHTVYTTENNTPKRQQQSEFYCSTPKLKMFNEKKKNNTDEKKLIFRKVEKRKQKRNSEHPFLQTLNHHKIELLKKKKKNFDGHFYETPIKSLETESYRFFSPKNDLEDSEDEFPELDSFIKVQPQHKLFACKICYQFHAIKEVSVHHSHCNKPKTLSHYIKKWQLLIQLLNEVNKSSNSSEVHKLTNMMHFYIQKHQNKGYTDNYMLYSDELSQIKLRKNQIEIQFINNSDLFYVIEQLGERIELMNGQQSSHIAIGCCY